MLITFNFYHNKRLRHSVRPILERDILMSWQLNGISSPHSKQVAEVSTLGQFDPKDIFFPLFFSLLISLSHLNPESLFSIYQLFSESNFASQGDCV